MTGSLRTTAMFIASKVRPWFEPPSPVKDSPTPPVFKVFAVNAAPIAKGGPPPTIPLAPSIPLSKSAICIEPPFPRHSPSSLPKISSIMA